MVGGLGVLGGGDKEEGEGKEERVMDGGVDLQVDELAFVIFHDCCWFRESGKEMLGLLVL